MADRPTSGKGSASYGRGATPEQLSQPSGTTLNGVTKVQNADGSYRMKRD